MKKTLVFTITTLFSLVLIVSGQTIDLTFTAVDNESYVQLDSIKVMNRTQGGDTVLYWPDTVLSFYYVGVNDNLEEENAFQVYQNYPNPVMDQTTVSINVPQKDKVSILITDILGRMMLQTARVLDRGKHSFQLTPGGGNLYFFYAQWQGQSSSIKILQPGFNSGGSVTLEYTGSMEYSPPLKTIENIQEFPFNPGDELLFIGNTDTLESGILDAPEESSIYIFQFATNIPCPGTPTVEYEGQIYNTIQIFSQCWLKENLNVGKMIPGDQQMTDNDTIERYCFDNDINNCTIYGGLYAWNEMMEYSTQQGIQGICPLGWHLPTDEEWMVLEGAVDSQCGIGDMDWGLFEHRGFNAGTNLKTTNGWSSGIGTDLYGFSGLPGGKHTTDFWNVGHHGYWWTSTEDIYVRTLSCNETGVGRHLYSEGFDLSVRCIKN